MPVKLTKLKSGLVRVTTPHGVKSYGTTPAKAEAQARLLESLEHRNPMETISLDSIVASAPPMYKLHVITTEVGLKLRPKVPVAMYPDATMHKVTFKFWGLNSYDVHIAFPSLMGAHTVPSQQCVSAIDYQIVVFGEESDEGGPSISAMYHHDFEDNHTYLNFDGLSRMHGKLICLEGALEHMPQLPNGWKYFQFVG